MIAAEALDQLYADVPARVYRKGSIIFDAHHKADGLYYISKGNVKLSIVDVNGREQIIYNLGPNDIFPLVGYFLGDNRPEMYMAVTNVQTQWRSRHDVEAYCNECPDALREMIRKILTLAMCRLHTLSLTNSRQRVLLRLQELAKRFGTPVDGHVAVGITQQELADSVSLSRESVSGVLSRLVDEKVVTHQRNKLFIDVKAVNETIAREV